MNNIVPHPFAMDGKDIHNLRGDRVTAERYFSEEYKKREWDAIWTKIWHVAGREQQLEEAGDYIVHHFMHESVFIVKQADGSLRGFYNVCRHRGQRLVWQDGSQESFRCPYHGFDWGLDGVLKSVLDPEDFSRGNPCGKLTLKEVRVDCWGGMVWYTMDPSAPPLLEFLEPVPDVFKNFPFEKLVRTRWVKVDGLSSNWKMYSDNFNESYHTREAHPSLLHVVCQDHYLAHYEMYPRGHASVIHPIKPSLRDLPREGQELPFDDTLSYWGIDPASYPDFATKVEQGWQDLKAAKRERWKSMGTLHYANMTDDELVTNRFMFIFPNIAISANADEVYFSRWEPHPDNPEECVFEFWDMAFPVEGRTSYRRRMASELKFEEADLKSYHYDGGKGVEELHELVVVQDWELAPGQQAGWRSRGYDDDPYICGQETRVRRFHEVYNDYLAGSPPGW